MLRTVLGVVAGVLAGFVIVFAVEWLGHRIFPMPAEMPTDPEGMKAMIASLPVETLGAVVAAWTLGALGGALIANAVARRAVAGWIAVLLLIAATVANLVMFPHPTWMAICGIALPVVMAWLAQRIQRLPV
jgi:hypothetical protein